MRNDIKKVLHLENNLLTHAADIFHFRFYLNDARLFVWAKGHYVF